MKIFYLKTKNGEIRRRFVLLSSLPKKRNPLESKKPKNRNIHWETSNIKILFNYWNSKKWPFVKHKTQNTKTIHRIIGLLKQYTKKYETREIINAIDLGHEILQDPGFMFYSLYRNRKIGFNEFLKYTPDTLEALNRNHKNKIPPSWFEIFLRGRDYVMLHYHIVPKDKNPHITKILTKAWVDYKRGSVDVMQPEFRKKIIKFSNLLSNFCRLNNMQAESLAGVIYNSLNDWKTIQLKHLNYALSKTFWSETIPQELVRYDYHGYRSKTFKSDWGELSK